MGRKILLLTGVAAAAAAISGASIATAGTTPGDDQPLTGNALQQASDAAIARTGPGTVISAETDNDPNTSYEVDVQLNNGTRVEVELDGSFQVVSEGRDDDPGQPLSAADRDRAGQAALANVGKGRIGDVERESGGGAAYEAEIVLDDGSEVDVELGADFQVLRTGAPERD
ncbi:hypothetical protein C3B78_15010 [Arthrobacter sp. PGP41]|uniref:PepSY domain-containing protein n=1 Tax=unclassified Arthrobacter TaxID=235627 RepID=UPI000CDC67E6|nr:MULTISPECIES: PepSY domain-containing protein [unclassified Arthrobacter]AUZ35632.1 hypothetical protein C3B78_15010 [Arthrobacter sp. PGP41]MDT0196943.1 PepSY domain-containing protein [Arthrobacter sp. AB6]